MLACFRVHLRLSPTQVAADMADLSVKGVNSFKFFLAYKVGGGGG